MALSHYYVKYDKYMSKEFLRFFNIERKQILCRYSKCTCLDVPFQPPHKFGKSETREGGNTFLQNVPNFYKPTLWAVVPLI